jgi:tRNA-specific 2-thiouridylase
MIAMSGGVDSAVAALLMKEQGFSVTGVTMRLFCDGEDIPCADGTTTDITPDIRDARAVAERLGIPHLVCRLEKTFCDRVVDDFVRTYLEGGTPNPCVTCNKTIKFGALLDFATAHNLTYAATGHYARIAQDENGRYLIRRALDDKKDQSYMLWSLTQDVLARVKLPLGELTKAEVREIAAAHGFESAQRKDSQDICFLPDGNYADFIRRYS